MQYEWPGGVLDQAVAARFCGSVKRERTSKRAYVTRQEARDDVSDYIAMFYHSWRQHSSLGYVSPQAYEKIAQAASFCVRFHLTTTCVRVPSARPAAVRLPPPSSWQCIACLHACGPVSDV